MGEREGERVSPARVAERVGCRAGQTKEVSDVEKCSREYGGKELVSRVFASS